MSTETDYALAESYASEYTNVRDYSTDSARNAAWSAVRAGYLKALESTLPLQQEAVRLVAALEEIISSCLCEELCNCTDNNKDLAYLTLSACPLSRELAGKERG